VAVSAEIGQGASEAIADTGPGWQRRVIVVTLAAAITAQVVGTYASLHPGWLPFPTAHPTLWLPAIALPYALTLALLARTRLAPRVAVGLIFAITALLQWIATTRPPLTSNDDLRYIWDGKIQLAGIDPYRYSPDALQLIPFHEPLLFTGHSCPVPTGCALINRPSVHTIYPPVAQASFVLVRLASAGGRGGQLPFQIAAALGVLAIAALLLRRAHRRGLAFWPAAAWGWCPIVVSEFGNNAHIDWLAVLLSLAGIGTYVAARPRWAGALVGAAILTKLYPALLLPSLLRRHPAKVLSAALGVIVLGYLPHVAAVGAGVIGYLPGYLDEEGYDRGSRLLLLGRVLPHPADTLVGLVLIAALAWWSYRRADPQHPERSAVWLVGAAFLIATPNYGWYAAILVALVAISHEWQWLPVAFAPTCTYLYGPQFADRHDADSLIYLTAALAVAAIWYLRRCSLRLDSSGPRSGRDQQPRVRAALGAQQDGMLKQED
jgi:alpha-1,2-mannosyltransferase